MRTAIKAPLKCLASASLLVGVVEVACAGLAELPVGVVGEVVDAALEAELDAAAEVPAADADGEPLAASVAEEVVWALVSLVTGTRVLITVGKVEFWAEVVGNLDLDVRDESSGFFRTTYNNGIIGRAVLQ